ncbi:DSD1 family PLP-dependent enzyme [Pontivivens ytuae]|uniref:DSD1 family PLP-dependent enzyme n=1 Tax=Pontivivens ytuae TaxID=2789856 RepID=A0A7S9QEE3_9RHOB|nr:DSD1 family PLP-dependent enzyme [Pontivivens ytuae]QPH55865.1 DSD1 family PLP-dependent enzyme [Pontivivens ytuae]
MIVGLDVPAEIGMAEAEVQTPALLIDLDAFDANLAAMRRIAEEAGIALRPHAKTHKSVDVAKAQIERGGARGICCQKVSEAEVFVAGGIADVFVTNEVRDPAKIARLKALAEHARIGVCVDDPAAVAELAGAPLHVYVEIDVGQGRCGCAPEDAADIARRIVETPGLTLAGLQAYQGAAQHLPDRDAAMARVMDGVRTALAGLDGEGIACPEVTGAGTGSYAHEIASGLYTELQCGSYIFMDADYRARGGDGVSPFRHALFVLAGIMSRAPGRAICDAGLKAMSMESGLPLVSGIEGVAYVGPSDEHGTIDDPVGRLAINDRVRLIPGHCDPTCNLHDWYVGVRGGVVETLWPVSARGKVW